MPIKGLKGFASERRRKGGVDRSTGKRSVREEKNVETGEGREKKGRRWTLPPHARIPAGANERVVISLDVAYCYASAGMIMFFAFSVPVPVPCPIGISFASQEY